MNDAEREQEDLKHKDLLQKGEIQINNTRDYFLQMFSSSCVDVLGSGADEIINASLHAEKDDHFMDSYQDRWYISIQDGKPDFSIYSEPIYVAESWACFIHYSRKYIRMLSKNLELMSMIGKVSSVVDLGCGVGLSTAMLCQVFNKAAVLGTNIDGTIQTKVARKIGEVAGFSVKCDSSSLDRRTDVLFASEYFEHFMSPVEHLNEVISLYNPRIIVAANTFSSPSIGHFPSYSIEGFWLAGRETSRAFNIRLRRIGYAKIETGFWNNRPTVWIKTEKETELFKNLTYEDAE